MSAVTGFGIVTMSPMLVGLAVGVTSTGPVAGGWFALSQGSALVSGGTMATIQSFVMGGVSTKTCALGGGAVAAFVKYWKK